MGKQMTTGRHAASGSRASASRRAVAAWQAAAGPLTATSTQAATQRVPSHPWPRIPLQSAGGVRTLASPRPTAATTETDLFTRSARQYASGRFGQQVTMLFAGASTAYCDLGADALRADGIDITVRLIDDDRRVTRAAVAAQARLSGCILGDLRAARLRPRSFDIVQCVRLLDRIHHAELVLDRLVAALKPGGLLLLQISDRDCAAGFLDRALPRLSRRLIWRTHQPGAPGPYPAVYEPLTSARGVHAYARLRGLVIAERHARGGRAGEGRGTSRSYLAVQTLIARLSRGRLTDAHEEMLYVIRKPEDRFARLI
jgi:SAM-dependent methyltransferase